MSAKMHIILEGLPERVQETANVLDQLFPGLMIWRRFAEPGRNCSVRLEGKTAEQIGAARRSTHLVNQVSVSGKTWKLSCKSGLTVVSRGGSFCGSLSKSL
jgi:hypothetical protein